MGQEAVERYPAVGDEVRALRLAGAREGPRGVDCELSTDHVLADVEGRRVALADERDPTPGGSAPYRGHARLGIAGAVHRGLDALAVGQLGERDQRVRRHAHERRVAAVARHAVDDDALPAELRPADATVLAPPASFVVMDHHALAGRRVRFADAGPALGDDAARLVAGDDGSAAAAQAQGRGRVAGGAVRVQVAPAHAGGLHGDEDLTGARRGVGEVTQLQLPVAEENYATHMSSLAA